MSREVVAQPARCQCYQRDGRRSPDPAPAEIPADNQCTLVAWPDSVAVDKRQPGPPGLPGGLAGTRFGPDRRAEPGEKMRGARHLMLAAVWRRRAQPLRPIPAVRSPVCRGPVRLRQIARDAAVNHAVQSRLEFLPRQLESVQALRNAQPGFDYERGERIVTGETSPAD